MNASLNNQKLQLNKEVVVSMKQKQADRYKKGGVAREAFITCCDGMSNMSTPFIRY